MSIGEWWPKLAPDIREWLIAHNGEPLSTEVAAAIARVGGAFDTDADVGLSEPSGPFELSEGDVDWIEAVANDEETPESR